MRDIKVGNRIRIHQIAPLDRIITSALASSATSVFHLGAKRYEALPARIPGDHFPVNNRYGPAPVAHSENRKPRRYNQKVRFLSALVLTVCLVGCNRGNADKAAVRQSVIDFVAGRGLNVSGMNVELTAVQFNGNHADATVSFTPKGGPSGSGMSMNYQLEQQGGKWSVVGRKDVGGPHGGGAMPQGGANPHGGGMMPPGDNPHGGAMPPAENPHGAAMPSPQDLPPTDKTKK